jgi:Flp pilus assembly protein TadG
VTAARRCSATRAAIARRRRHGAVTLFFVMVALPLTWIAGAVAVDYSKIVTTRQQTQLMLDAAALAAAAQLTRADITRPAYDQVQPPVIDAAAATSAARAVVCEAFAAGQARLFPGVSCSSTVVVLSADKRTVTVQLSHRVAGLSFLGLASGFGSTSIDAVTRSRASICIATTGSAEERCTRPLSA